MPEPGNTQQEEMQKDLLKSFHEEFSSNQNHHQSIFIQVISAVLVVIIGYGLVFANTASAALPFDVIRDGGNITSYAIIHLTGTYLIAQFILILLGSLIMNIGYTFRRDQLVNYNIRKHYLGEELYEKTFGHRSFDPRNKGFVIRSFLPGFNLIFFSFIFVLQLLLWISVMIAFCNFKNLSHSLLCGILLIFPWFISLRYFQHYYYKYKKTVK
jgi:hypothetical protein